MSRPYPSLATLQSPIFSKRLAPAGRDLLSELLSPAARVLSWRQPSLDGKLQERDADRLLPVLLSPDSPAIGRALGDFAFDGIVVTALVRQGERQLTPSRETCLEAGDALVLFGSPEDLRRTERELLS